MQKIDATLQRADALVTAARDGATPRHVVDRIVAAGGDARAEDRRTIATAAAELKDATRASVGPPLCTPTEGEHANFLSILEGKKLRDVLQRAKRMKCSKEVILSEEDFNSACLEYEEKYSIFFRVHQLYRDTRGARSSLKLPMHPNDAKVLEQLYSFLKEDLIKLKSLIEDFQSKCTNPTSHSNCNNK